MDKDPSGCGHLFSLRRTGAANRKMLETLQTSGNTFSTQKQADLFKQIRHEARVIEQFDSAVSDTKTWPVLYDNENPYESTIIRNIKCVYNNTLQNSSIYMKANLSAPAIQAVCLLWAVEYIGTWSSIVKNAYILEEIDTMSRHVMINVKPGILSMFKTVVAFVKLSVIEVNERGKMRVGISVENMPNDAIEKYKKLIGNKTVVNIQSVVVCISPLTDDLEFEISVLYSRRTPPGMFNYIHNCMFVHFLMPFLCQLASMAIKTAMLDRSAICLDSWIADRKSVV